MKAILVANWKMNPTSFREAKRLFDATKKIADREKHISLIVAPPSIFLRELRANYRGRTLSLAAQSAHFEAEGAYTGEMSMLQVKDARVSHVLVGHSERRKAGETNEDTRKKVATALKAGLIPILCIGETERTDGGQYLSVLKEQLRTAFADVPAGQVSKVIVGYEPAWAIGGEQTIRPREMHEMSIFIRKTVYEMHGEKGMALKVLYGASVTDENAHAMLEEGDVNGLIVGHVSIDPPRFAKLLHSLA